VDENVFAYSNRVGDERALVLYHNRYGDTRGWVRTSVGYAVKDSDGAKTLVQMSLGEALGVSDESNHFLIFRDVITGLEFIRSCRDLSERGLYAELFAYQVYVFLDFREVEDGALGEYAALNEYLKGRGASSIDEAMQEMLMGPIHVPLRMLLSAPAFRWLVAHAGVAPETVDNSFRAEIEQKMLDVLQGAKLVLDDDLEAGLPAAELARDVVERVELVLSLPDRVRQGVAASKEGRRAAPAVDFLLAGWPALEDSPVAWEAWGALFGWTFTTVLGRVVDAEHGAAFSRDWFDEWLLRKLVAEALAELGVREDLRQRVTLTIRLLLSAPEWLPAGGEGSHPLLSRHPGVMLRRALRHRDVQAYLGVNRYDDVLWFSREAFERWLWWIACLEALRLAEREETAAEFAVQLLAVYRLVTQLQAAEALSAYQVDALIEAAETLSGGPRV
jgi:hypothetical protein